MRLSKDDRFPQPDDSQADRLTQPAMIEGHVIAEQILSPAYLLHEDTVLNVELDDKLRFALFHYPELDVPSFASYSNIGTGHITAAVFEYLTQLPLLEEYVVNEFGAAARKGRLRPTHPALRSDDDVQDVTSLWRGAKTLIEGLESDSETSAVIQLTNGEVEVEFDIADYLIATEPFREKFRTLASDFLEKIRVPNEQLDHVVLTGRGAYIRGALETLADAVEWDETEILAPVPTSGGPHLTNVRASRLLELRRCHEDSWLTSCQNPEEIAWVVGHRLALNAKYF